MDSHLASEEKARIKPNQPCACGSGGKYRECCGAPEGVSSEEVRRNSEPRPQLKGTLGLSGIEISMSLLRHYKDPNDPRNAAGPSGSPGEYKVSFILSRPRHSPLNENQVSFADDVRGDSHVFTGDPNQVMAEFQTKLPEGNFTFYGYSNDKGFLSKIEIEKLQAVSFGDAILKAHNAVSPTLSRLSLLLDVPLHIYKATTIELSTQNLMSHVTLPFAAKPVLSFTGYQPNKDLAKFASLYREGLNSNSPNYQFLCYYKIIEGIRRIRSDRAKQENREALARGEKPPAREKEILPTDRNEQTAWLSSIFTPQRWSDLALRQVFSAEAVGRTLGNLI